MTLLSRSVLVSLLLTSCGGGQQSSTPTQPPTTTTTTTTTGPSPQCKVLTDRADAFTADLGKIDPNAADRVQATSALAKAAATDIGAAQVTGDLQPIAHDASALLMETSQRLGQIGGIITHMQGLASAIDVEAVKTCVLPPSRAIGLACKGKTTGDCPTVVAAIDAWGKSSKADQNRTLTALRTLTVTEQPVKARLADVMKCVKPISDALDGVDHDRAQIDALGHKDLDEREQQLDARFKPLCGRALFNNP